MEKNLQQNILEFLSWGCEFKVLVESSINEWIGKAGGEAGKLLRGLQQYWISSSLIN
jgi:hypothetical protein